MSRDVRMRGFQNRSTVEETFAVIDARVVALDTETIPFRAAEGRILAEDVVAPRSVPPHPKSAMDGYAVRAADLPGSLTIVGEVKAADSFDREMKAGEAVRIMTGAQIPNGADTVVMVEQTTVDGDSITIKAASPTGHHVLRIGEDLMAGKAVLHKGRRLRPQDVAMLVSVDALEVKVQRRPRVLIIPTGTELVEAGRAPKATDVVESNSYMLEGLARRDGADVSLHPILRDDQELLKSVLSEADADLVVVTGGSSVGKEDFGPVVVREIGELPIHGIHVKPASPTGVGFIGKTAVVLAPGYPVASFVAWDLFASRIIQRMLGVDPHLPYPKQRVRLGFSIKKPMNRVMLQRCMIEEGSKDAMPTARMIPGGSALLSTITKADGFVLLWQDQAEFGENDIADLYRYGIA